MKKQGRSIENGISIIHGLTEQYYHLIPSELESITISPERQAIFNYLAQIGSDRFHEFIVDILTHTEGHKLIDITNGPGDEKQDILTETPSGQRHLTQCKHTINYQDNYSGDELDLLFSACCRKNCPQGLFVTNSDLTPQGKRYITDREYARADFVPEGVLPTIDYWNGERIWQRISTNTNILNKWFSGMGQAHGLRKFYFDMVILRLPAGTNYSIKCTDVAKALEKSNEVKSLNNGKIFEVELSKDASFIISDSVISDFSLGAHYVGPETESQMVNTPMSSLRIEMTIANTVGQYNPKDFLDSVVKLIGDLALPKPSASEWWYIATTTPKAFIFLHDLAQPQPIPISEAESYVRVVDDTVIEQQWVFPMSSDFKRSTEEEKGSLKWLHSSSGVEVNLLLEQRSHPVTVYEMHVHQLRLLKKISQYEFRAIRDASQEIVDKVRRLVDLKWVVMLSNTNILFWAFPPTEDQQKVQAVDVALMGQGITVYQVPANEKQEVLKLIDVSPIISEWSLVSTESDLVTPIWLDKRIFWLYQSVLTLEPKQEKTWLELVKFKADYEVKYGFDHLGGKKQSTMSGREIPSFLFDIYSIRGLKMLDVTFDDTSMHVYLRVKVESPDSFSAISPQYLDEIKSITGELLELLKTCEVD